MKIKYSLAVALSHEADLLIMDEPTSGLDPVFRRELLDLLADMIQDETRSIIFSTHITTDLERIADYITFIHQGKLVFYEAKDDVLERYTIVKGIWVCLIPTFGNISSEYARQPLVLKHCRIIRQRPNSYLAG